MYTTKGSDMRPDIVPVAYSMFEREELDFIDEDKVFVTCYHDGDVEINVGDEIVCTYSAEFGDEVGVFSNNQYYEVTASDTEELYFSMMVDRYFDLKAETFLISNINEYVEETDEYVQTKYLYVYFKNHHFFNEDAEFVSVLFPDEELKNDEETVIDFEMVGHVYGARCIRFRLTEYELYDCSEVTDADDSELCNNSNAETESLNELIHNNVKAAAYLALYSGLISTYDEFGDFIDGFEGVTESYSAEEYRFLRYNFMFYDQTETDRLTLGVYRPSTVVSIPLFSKLSTDLNQETNVSDRFTKVEIKKAINPIEDMEKDVYSPGYIDDNNFTEATEIRFNLHLRQHRGEDWMVEKDASWNGVTTNKALMDKSNSRYYGFFSYPFDKEENIDQRDSQSDLLTYLGFTDSDVKYRKNKLKKTFLRLSFYDSTQPTNQNLLAYSTVFVDTGKLYGKYMRNFEYPKKANDSFGFSRFDYESVTGETKSNLSGSRVSREPYWYTTETDIDLIESLRLSSQFVIKDKYSSDSSSEGFYLYLWKNMATETPFDIYMKVELNHAGYGRTIPFMMPYGENGLKTFSQIASADGYSIQEYMQYSYIHLKCKYDSNEKRCIYYPDPAYEIGKDGIITFNIYEAKVK